MSVKIAILRNTKLHFIVISILISITWLTVTFVNTADIPINDDYGSILGPTVMLLESQSWQESYQVLIKQHGYHRIVLVKALAFFMYKIFGDIYFNYFALIGNILLVLLSVVFIKSANIKVHYFAYIPVVLLVCSLQNFKFATFAMASVSNHGSLLFSCLSVVVAAKKGFRYIVASSFLFLIAFLLQGGALPVIFVIFLMLLLQKRHIENILFVMISAGICIWYFWDYSYMGPVSVVDVISNPYQFIIYFFNFLGNAFGEGSPFINPLAIGIAIVAFLGYITIRKRYYKKNILLYSLFVYFILLALLSSLSRSYFGIEYALNRHAYALYSLLTIALVYMIIIEVINRRYINMFSYFTIIITTVYLFSASTTFFYEMVAKRERVERFFVNWIFGQGRLPVLPGEKHYKKANAFLNRARKLDVYNYPIKYKNVFSLAQLHKRNKKGAKTRFGKVPNNEWNLYITPHFRSILEVNDNQKIFYIKLGYLEELLKNKDVIKNIKEKNINGRIRFMILGKGALGQSVILYNKLIDPFLDCNNVFEYEKQLYVTDEINKLVVIMNSKKSEHTGLYFWFNIKLENKK